MKLLPVHQTDFSFSCPNCDSHHGVVRASAHAIGLATELGLTPIVSPDVPLLNQAADIIGKLERLLSVAPLSLEQTREWGTTEWGTNTWYNELWKTLDTLAFYAQKYPKSFVQIRESPGAGSVLIDVPKEREQPADVLPKDGVKA